MAKAVSGFECLRRLTPLRASPFCGFAVFGFEWLTLFLGFEDLANAELKVEDLNVQCSVVASNDYSRFKRKFTQNIPIVSQCFAMLLGSKFNNRKSFCPAFTFFC